MSSRIVQRGFTLIEAMVTIAIAAILVMLAAPSFEDMILMQRLRGVNAQIITDLQYARAEAVARGRYVRFSLGSDDNQTCYTIFVNQSIGENCKCTDGAGSACDTKNKDYLELKTVSIPKSGKVLLAWPLEDGGDFAFDYVTGGLITSPTDQSPKPLPKMTIEARVDDDRRLINDIIQTGRPHVCAPNPEKMQVPAC